MNKTQKYSLKRLIHEPTSYWRLLTGRDSNERKKNRRRLENYIIRGIGDRLKMGTKTDIIAKEFPKALSFFNHGEDFDECRKKIYTIIDWIKREGWYEPYGLKWSSLTLCQINRIINWRTSFNKETDWKVFCAIYLLGELETGGAIKLGRPQVLDILAAIERHTRYRSLKRLEESGYIKYCQDKYTNCLEITITAMPIGDANRIVKTIDISETTDSENQGSWYQLHELLASRPPWSKQHYQYPLIYMRDKSLQHRLGTVSINQLIAAVTMPLDLYRAWDRKLRRNNPSYHLHQNANDEISTIPKRLPYPVIPGFWDQEYIKVMKQYQLEVAVPAMDRGIPFDAHAARKLLYQLHMVKLGVINWRNLDINIKEPPKQSKIKSLINNVRELIRLYNFFFPSHFFNQTKEESL